MTKSALFFSLGNAIAIGWLLYIGRPILIPIIAAVMSIYLLSSAAAVLGNIPVIGRLPPWILRGFALILFFVAVSILAGFLLSSVAPISSLLPRYEGNLEALLARGMGVLGVSGDPSWARMFEFFTAEVDLRSWFTWTVQSFGSFGGSIVVVLFYAVFMFAERDQFDAKLSAVVPNEGEQKRLTSVFETINSRVGEYLVVKTVVNIALGLLSFAIMWIIGIEFAVFWAILIALLNYIPYIGSIVGVVFPVLLSLAQFGSVTAAVFTLVSLTVVQMFVAGFLEPRMMGRAFNLSPLVILIALSFWSSIWGLPGAILAIPMTSVLLIVLAEIPGTRAIAILLSADGRL